MHQSLLEGENRFGWLYEDAKYEKFSACFGSLIGGHSRRHFKDLLDAKTVKNKNSKLVAEASKRWSSWLRSLGEVLFIRDGREKLTCKACMVSRFWFLVPVLPIRGMHRIQKLLTSIMKPIGRKKCKNQKRKRVFGFSFLSDQFYWTLLITCYFLLIFAIKLTKHYAIWSFLLTITDCRGWA